MTKHHEGHTFMHRLQTYYALVHYIPRYNGRKVDVSATRGHRSSSTYIYTPARVRVTSSCYINHWRTGEEKWIRCASGGDAWCCRRGNSQRGREKASRDTNNGMQRPIIIWLTGNWLHIIICDCGRCWHKSKLLTQLQTTIFILNMTWVSLR